VIVDDLDVERIAIAEFKADTPTVVDRHRPLLFPRALQFVQSNAPQWTEILKTLGHVECRQQIDCSIDVKAAELCLTDGPPNAGTAEGTTMDPAKRFMLRVVLLADDRAGTADSVERLMGTKAEARLPSFPTRRNSPARTFWTCEEARWPSVGTAITSTAVL
jgi:hypothetical protein